MIIPTKYNGYQAGRRLYPMGGGGDGAKVGTGTGTGAGSGNMNIVNQAYGNIGRASVGTNPNQIDQGGQNYWLNQLNSGAIAPKDFANKFSNAAQVASPATANIYQNQALSQIRGARPDPTGPQFYQPAFQPQYNNYATTNPLGVSQYGTAMTPRSLVDSAYAGIGRYGSGSQMNQVDPEGRQYYEKQLSSGAITPQDFASVFNNAANTARQNTNDPYGQYLQNQTGYSGGYQGYARQPTQRVSYQQPASASIAQPSGAKPVPFKYQPSSSNVLTPEIAKNLMQASMSGGVDNSEFARYGGYDKVQAVFDAAGGVYARPDQQASGAFPPQNPFSYQTALRQPSKDYGLTYSAPMQLPQYVYDTIRDIDSYQSQPVQAYKSPRATSSGPSQAIVGRSSQIRGTPNVVAKKAAGGIASLLDKYK
jgi:hypothetical protein